MDARRAKVEVVYKGKDITESLEPYLVLFTYTDNEGAGDDVQLTLQDREGKWHGAWFPEKGDAITATIVILNWKKEGHTAKLYCGKFFVDTVDFKGAPDTLTIKALSIPIKESGKNAKNTRSWEKASLSTVAGDIARSAGLSLIYDAPDYIYDRVDQKRQTDLAFIRDRAKREGIAVKVTDGKLVLYDEQQLEAKKTARDIARGESDVLSYTFSLSTADKEYKKVEISYFDSSKKKNVKYTYEVPGVEQGPTLKLNQRAKSLAEAKRIAQKAAREKNKRTRAGKIRMVGDPELIQGLTVDVKNFLKFDGKYFIESATHSVGGGYTADVNIREVLNY